MTTRIRITNEGPHFAIAGTPTQREFLKAGVSTTIQISEKHPIVITEYEADMNECPTCKGPLIAPSLGRIGCQPCDWSETVDPDGNLAGPDFSDGPEFAGWAERSGDGWECKACSTWHAPRSLCCSNNKCTSYTSDVEAKHED